ncbi:MAG: family 43 glycosylhydrolase [Candidatus Alcyoniella australis]|nr:family 43 glycosylhydrolase [Candidatus Alcyoniella australis]
MRFPTLIILLLAIVAFPASVLGYSAPIDLPGAPSAADPHVLYHEGTYYLYPTTGFESDRLECWSSTDLEHWDYRGVIWGPVPAGWWNDGKIWAPHVERDPLSGRFYLYYTANEKIGMAVSDSPIGPFFDVFDHPFIGDGYGGCEFNAIDAFIWREPDGRLFIYYVGYEPWATIRVSSMPDYEHVDPWWIVLTRPLPLSWEGFINEGPWMFKRGNTYYLMYSGNGGNLPWYAIGFAVGSDPLGPFKKYVYNPILSTDVDRNFFAPGHHSLARTPEDPNQYLIFYHTKDSPLPGWERSVRIDRLQFSHGIPYVDPDDDDDDPAPEPPPVDDDSDDDDDLEWCGN